MKILKESIKQKSGIYFIKNIISKKVYIGQSKNCYKRLIMHRFKLSHNKHGNSHLQRSFNKYGKKYFKCGIIKYCNNLTEEEIFYMNNQKCEIYNIRNACESVTHPKRKKITEKTRNKLKKAKIGKEPSNLKWLQQKNRRKIKYSINGILIKNFNSCKDAAEYFGMKKNLFHKYIGKLIGTTSKPSKYFKKGTLLEYIERRDERYL